MHISEKLALGGRVYPFKEFSKENVNSSKGRKLVVALLFLAGVLLAGRWAGAQSFQGQLTGEVKDSTGAVVVGAAVHVTDVEKGTTFSAESDVKGAYKFAALLPSTYRLTVEKPGFATFEADNVILAVNQTLQIDVTLTVGKQVDTVTVDSSAGQMDTATATLGQVVTTQQIEELPLDVRDPLGLVILTPGTVTGSDFGDGGGPSVGRNFFKSNFNVGGGKSGSQALLIDGAPNTTGDVSRAIINPPVDAVQEFKVQAITYDAQFGRTSGAIINLVTKSGTNSVHGAVYDFERDSSTQAQQYFASGTTPDWHRRQAGGVVGFPILHDRLFFFGDYETLRQGYPVSTRSTVPTPAEKLGDFTGLTYTSGGSTTPVVIYDPATYNTTTKMRSQIVDCDGVTVNKICSSRISDLAKAILAKYPDPNTAGGTNNVNNYVYNNLQTTDSNKYDLRADVNLHSQTMLFGRYSRQTDDRLTPGTLPPDIAGTYTHDRYTQIVLGLTRVISPSLLVNITTSFSRALAVQSGGLPQVDLAGFGFSSNFASQAAPQMPIFSTTDVTSLNLKSDVGQQHQPRNTYATSGYVTWQHGFHSFKFGGEFWILDFNEYQNAVSSGSLKFDHSFTQKNPASATSKTQGSDLADLLLGIPSGVNAVSGSSGSYIRKVQAISTRGIYDAAFFQDDYRVMSKLTLNLGLRWDVNIGDREKYNRLAWFDPNAPSPLGPAIGNTNLKGSVVWVGGGNDKDQQQTSWADLNPRFGFAYQIRPKFTMRGGYGIFFLPRSVQGSGVGAVGTTVDTDLPVDSPVSPNTLADPFASGVNLPNNDRSPLAGVGSTISIPTHAFKAAYVQMFSFGFQRELPWGILSDVHYWGNLGTHIPMVTNANVLPNQYLSLGSSLATSQVANPFYGLIPGQTATVTLRQSLLPFPQYVGDTGVSIQLDQRGKTNYHAITAQAQKFFSKNLTFTVQYTYGKAMDDLTTPLNNNNHAAEYALSDLDVTNQFISSFIVRLPYGHGRRWGASSSNLVNALLGNWNVNGIYRMQSGFPVGVTRPSNLAAGAHPHLDHPTPDRWFDTTGITTAQYSYGNIGPQLPGVRSDPLRGLDAVVEKAFNYTVLRHAYVMQFRAEAYNALNHPQFAAPIGTITSANFGTVTSQANQPRAFQFAVKVKF